MGYLRATAAGVAGAVMFAVAWLLAAIALPVLWQVWSQRDRDAGIGAVSVVVTSRSLLLVALAGFVVGFAWMMRRR